MAKVLSSTYSSLVTLTGLVDTPATIAATGLLDAGLYASSLGAAWLISNAGSVLGAGLTLGSVGTVTNAGSVVEPRSLHPVLVFLSRPVGKS